MTSLLVRHRRWAYLLYALGMLYVPFGAGYVDDVNLLRGIVFALLPLTLIAYLEIFAAAERGSLNYRKMTGNPDLLILADTQPVHSFPAIWRAWIGGWGWLTMAALIIGRFAAALAMSHYLHIFTLNRVLHMFSYVSHNGYYEFWWPTLGQMSLAFGTLSLLAVVESRLMIALATVIYMRVRRRQQWRLMSFIGVRVAFGLVALVMMLGMFNLISAALNRLNQPQAHNFPTYMCYDSKGIFSPSRLPDTLCRDIMLAQHIQRVGETVQIALFTQFDGGVMTAASLMRPHQTRRFRGAFLEYRPQFVNPNINSFSYQTTYWLISPWWLIFRMLFAALLSMIIMGGLTRWLWRQARYT